MSSEFTEDTLTAVGMVTAPATNALIATLALPAKEGNTALYKVSIITGQTGTVDNTHLAGLKFTHGISGTQVLPLLSPAYPVTQVLERISWQPGNPPIAGEEPLSVYAAETFVASSIVYAMIMATRVD
jgi:hypothetical protein